MKRFVKWMLRIAAILVVIFGIFLALMTYFAYNPAEREVIHTNSKVQPYSLDTLRILSWNIGYAGLDKDMDFFMDGGNRMRQTEDQTVENLDAAISFLRHYQDVDFYLLQEVDIKSRRSYKVDELSAIALALKSHLTFFALNYKVELVPVPITNPMGVVESGIVSFSKYNPYQVVRHSYPSSESWPMRIFNLRRCFISLRIPLTSGSELVLVNTHNSAYDDGSQRQQEMSYLRNYLLAEEKKGNYVIVGGDWNQTPPGYPQSKGTEYFRPLAIDSTYMPSGWQWFYDSATPSNRFLDSKYQAGITQTTILDFFLCSPEVRCIDVKTINLEFEHSDHNPVLLTVVLDK